MIPLQIVYAFNYFLGVIPTPEEVIHLEKQVSTEARHDGYITLDRRVFTEPKGTRQTMVLYSSCHCDQIETYLRHYRQDVLDRCYVHMVITHRMGLNRPHSNNRLVWAIFANADLIIHNYLSEKFGEFSTDTLFKHCKPEMKSVTFVPPSCACWWPVTEFHGEDPIEAYLAAGKTGQEMIDLFLSGRFDCKFEYRFKSQIDRLAFRERNRDVKISEYIMRHYRTHKMFFTFNHPSFHLMSYATDECLGKLGFDMFGEDHSLSVPVNLANFGSHYTETEYEWDFYKFEYPKCYVDEQSGARGTASQYYPQVVRDAIARQVKRNGPMYLDLEDDL